MQGISVKNIKPAIIHIDSKTSLCYDESTSNRCIEPWPEDEILIYYEKERVI